MRLEVLKGKRVSRRVKRATKWVGFDLRGHREPTRLDPLPNDIGQIAILGFTYRVRRGHETPYILLGEHGLSFKLVRDARKPEQMFLVAMARGGTVPAELARVVVTDRRGHLEYWTRKGAKPKGAQA